jgi:hypothetical protein
MFTWDTPTIVICVAVIIVVAVIFVIMIRKEMR